MSRRFEFYPPRGGSHFICQRVSIFIDFLLSLRTLYFGVGMAVRLRTQVTQKIDKNRTTTGNAANCRRGVLYFPFFTKLYEELLTWPRLSSLTEGPRTQFDLQHLLWVLVSSPTAAQPNVFEIPIPKFCRILSFDVILSSSNIRARALRNTSNVTAQTSAPFMSTLILPKAMNHTQGRSVRQSCQSSEPRPGSINLISGATSYLFVT